jgi:dUTP pyrophosphatase
MQVQVKRLDTNAVIPVKAHADDAGLDLTATSVKATDKYIEYGTGLAVSIPRGHVGLLFPRSSISNSDLSLANSVGVVDAGYFGEIKLRFKKIGLTDPYFSALYNVGDRIGQLIIMPIPAVTFDEVSDLGDSERATGGFGSSGN